MNLVVPAVMKSFVALFAHYIDKRKQTLIPVVLSCFLLCRSKKSYAALSRSIITEQRNRATISKYFKRPRLRSRDIYTHALHSVIEISGLTGKQVKRKRETWVMPIDGVCSKRGGFTKIENAIKYKKKKTKQKGRSTKAHTFIMGMLITHTGMRLPVPRRSFYTKRFCRKTGRKFVSMTKLARLMIEQAKSLIPDYVDLVVVADGFFEGKLIHEVCERLHYTYICPVKSSRCYENKEGKRLSTTLYKKGLSLNRTELTRIIFNPYQEETVLLRRRTGKDKRKRRYYAASEKRAVSGLGEVLVVYSWKPRKKRKRWDRNWFKVLVTNAKSWTVRRVIEYYELRWQVEILFRELKSFLGMSDYQGSDFEAFERYVDMVMLAYLFLEWLRIIRLKEVKSYKDRAALRKIRTHSLILLFQKEVDKESIEFLKTSFKNPAKLNDLLEQMDKRIFKMVA